MVRKHDVVEYYQKSRKSWLHKPQTVSIVIQHKLEYKLEKLDSLNPKKLKLDSLIISGLTVSFNAWNTFLHWC